MKKIKVLQINSVYGVGSTGDICLDIEQNLDGDDIEFYMAYSTPSNILPIRGFLFGSNFERKVHALGSRLTGLQGYFSTKAMLSLIKYMDDINPDIVHLHNLHSNDINLPLLYKYFAEKKKKVVITLHDCWPFTGKCTYYTMVGCSRWMKSCGKCVKKSDDNVSWFFDMTEKQLADKKKWYGDIDEIHVIAVSDWIYSESKKSILSKSKSITRIYNWIDTEVFKPAPRNEEFCSSIGVDEGEFIILSVASEWNERKGLDSILAIAKNLPFGMRYLLIGRLPKNLELPNSIIHISQINNSVELAKAYSISSVLINASAEESFGKVSAEAMSSGIPIIGLNSTATAELIVPGTGYKLDSLDIAVIQKCLNAIQKNGKKFYESVCRDSALKRFNKLNLLNDYKTLYKKIFNK